MESLKLFFEGIKEENQKGKMIAIPVEIGGEISLPGESVEKSDRHITIGLMYGDEKEDEIVDSVLKELSSKIKPFKIKISQLGVFEPNGSNHGKYVLWAKPEGNAIHKLHEVIFKKIKSKGLKIDNGSFDFSPHITLKYCDENPAELIKKFNSKKNHLLYPVTKLRFASRGENFFYPLKKVS